MSAAFAFVHSPLVGPYSWVPLADRLDKLGHKTVVFSYGRVLARNFGFTKTIVEESRNQFLRSPYEGPVFLVGHSAAGAYLPAVRSAIDGIVDGYIFVDARLPERGRSLDEMDTQESRSQRQTLARDGFLPEWSEWFAAGVMEAVLPDQLVRENFLNELHKIPLGLFSEPIPVPNTWPDAPCGYLRLSEFYRPLASEARLRGWPVIEIDAQHLHALVDPVEVAGIILQLARELTRPGKRAR